jgi:hypothetical protein
VGYLLRHNVMSHDRTQARIVAPRLLATDWGCLRGSTVRDPNKIWERLEPFFCE